jgi:hypothetical protein
MKLAVCLLLLVAPSFLIAQKKVIVNKTIHLRDGIRQEWNTFPVNAKDSILKIHFNSNAFKKNAVISLIQTDVSHPWKVELNGTRLGNLVVDENRMITYFQVPAGVLIENANTLIIRPEKQNQPQPDDILISKVILFYSAIDDLLSESSLNIQVGLPARLTILNENGALQPVQAAAGDTLAIRSGVIYSGTGNYSFTLPSGRYKIYASRGFEYSVDSFAVNATRKQSHSKKLTLNHEVDLEEWVSCDPHIHTLEYSGHGDATMKERALTIAGEGLDYGVITEHNKAVDISDTVRKMGLDRWFTAITGDELTTKVGHFNIFPVEAALVPSADVNNWREVAENIKIKDRQVVILNHSRDVHNGFRPSDSLQVVAPHKFPANAMEIINSGSQQTNPRELYLDWMSLMNRGIILTPVGSSDSHDVSRFIVGQSRTYVRSDGDLVANFIDRRVGVSFGIFTELTVDSVSNSALIRVYAPSWIKPEKVILFANSKPVFTSTIARKKVAGLVAEHKVTLSGNSHKTILVAVAEGPDPRVPWWPVAKPYQHTSPVVQPIVMGISGPIIIKE